MKKVALITGANRGIGKGIALKFAKEGYNIAAFARDEKTLHKAVEEYKALGADVIWFLGDAADEKFAADSVKKVIEKFGTVDVLINNAGTRVFKKVVDATLDDFKKQVNPNIFGVFNFTHEVLPFMIKQKSGNIINIASLAGKNAFPTGAMYSATKHAVLGFTKSLMLEVREYNIRVAAICPGSVNTEFFDGISMKPNKEKILQVNDVAEAVFAIISLPQGANMSEIDIRPTNP